MSCIRFSTPAQRVAMKRLAPPVLTSEEAAALHPAPEWTPSRTARLRTLAEHANPRIRESVASSAHAPADVIAVLARDPDEGVRSWVARNEHVSCDVLRALAGDPSERVRGFVAVNRLAPKDAMARLADDASDVVRSLVAWKASLRRG